MQFKVNRKALIQKLRAIKALEGDAVKVMATGSFVRFLSEDASIPIVGAVTETGEAYLDEVAVASFLDACKRTVGDEAMVLISDDGRVEVSSVDGRLYGSFDGWEQADSGTLQFPATKADSGP